MGKLLMTFEANTIKHLGVKMYSNLPPALAELIANAYDACAKRVDVHFYDADEKRIVVKDDGIGMSFEEVNKYFLKIGRNRREDGQESPCGRIPTGKKGLGKLALFGIGDTIEIVTTKEGKTVTFRLDWNEILEWKGSDYEPKFDVADSADITTGTTITLTNLKRKTGFPIDEYSENLAKFFDFKDDFTVRLTLNNGEPFEIDGKTKFKSITSEFKWDIKTVIAENEKEYAEKEEISGTIITTEKPLKANLRGVTLFANGRMVNSPEFFGPSESSHFFSYATGWLNVDFIDNWDEDVISTNRQSIDWENDKTSELGKYLVSCLSIVERQWREFRKEKKQKELRDKVKLDVQDWIDKLPENVQGQVGTIVSILEDSPELSEDTQQTVTNLLHEIAPEYANLHWRNLESEIRDVAEKYYQSGDYYTAFVEALKRYIGGVKAKSGSTNSSERSMMGEVFSNRKLSVTKKFKKTDGSDFADDTIKNIEEGQHYLSEGIFIGGRNPLQHEEHLELSRTGLFSEKDCLDFLSLLSHLHKRLGESEPPE